MLPGGVLGDNQLLLQRILQFLLVVSSWMTQNGEWLRNDPELTTTHIDGPLGNIDRLAQFFT
jgi:hypothetical protein